MIISSEHSNQVENNQIPFSACEGAVQHRAPTSWPPLHLMMSHGPPPPNVVTLGVTASTYGCYGHKIHFLTGRGYSFTATDVSETQSERGMALTQLWVRTGFILELLLRLKGGKEMRPKDPVSCWDKQIFLYFYFLVKTHLGCLPKLWGI